jgi:hypothetical protein
MEINMIKRTLHTLTRVALLLALAGAQAQSPAVSLVLDGGANQQGTLVQTWTSNGTADQLWTIQPSGSGASITSVQSGIALDGGVNQVATHPQMYPVNSAADQQWVLQ